MINTKDQEELFKLIAEYLEESIECFAIGGTAMMFSNYKNTTKDIDIVFKDEKSKKIFVKAIEELGYKKTAIVDVYDKKRKESQSKPEIFSRGEERFDLFVKSVFGFKLDFDSFVQRHDFIGKRELTLYVPMVELLVLLKSITNRERDYEDIETTVKIEKNLDWDFVVNQAIKQKDNLPWVLIDLEETMQSLKKISFIKKRCFDRLYEAQSK